MKAIAIFALSAALAGTVRADEWPVAREFDSAHLARIALPLGGIGTGTVSLGGRGELCDWEIMNRPAKGHAGQGSDRSAPFFAVSVKGSGARQTRMLAGPLYPFEYLEGEGRPVQNHGLPRFAAASFKGAYPLGQVCLSDDVLPVRVRVRGFNPLLPGDVEASSLPIAALRYEVTNVSAEPLEVSVCGNVRNFVGCDGSRTRPNWHGMPMPCGAVKNRNEFRDADGLKGVVFLPGEVDRKDPAWGSFALVTTAADGVTHRTDSERNDWSKSIQDFWDDFSADGEVENRPPSGDDDPMAALCVKRRVAPGATSVFEFYFTWNFPNRTSWDGSALVGNWYSHRFPDPWRAAAEIVPRMPDLERRTVEFVRGVLALDAPAELKEAALSNLSALRCQTVFRLPSGHLMGWEGVFDRVGSCMGSCTHVWNYDEALPFLFPELARTMRDVEFNYALGEDGGMSFRVDLPLEAKGRSFGGRAADGQMGCIEKVYREWRISKDDAWLAAIWPKVRLALSFAWRPGSWDADADGVMEGSQHNTMDVNYEGPNPQMQFWYLGALKAAEEMAKALGDGEFAAKCASVRERGSAWTEANLFNGEYYEHRVPEGCTAQFQIGRGCLVDQLVGYTTAQLIGLGRLGDPDHRRRAVESVWRYNRRADMAGEFRHQRSYAMAGEAGLLMASWPHGGRERFPFPYFTEVMTGFEYVAATEMVFAGMRDEALRTVRDIRARHDGAKRNPFSEPECGHHYSRALASWGTLRAWTGAKVD